MNKNDLAQQPLASFAKQFNNSWTYFSRSTKIRKNARL